MGLALLNSCSLHELSEIRRLIDAGSCLMILGGWLDLIVIMQITITFRLYISDRNFLY